MKNEKRINDRRTETFDLMKCVDSLRGLVHLRGSHYCFSLLLHCWSSKDGVGVRGVWLVNWEVQQPLTAVRQDNRAEEER